MRSIRWVSTLVRLAKSRSVATAKKRAQIVIAGYALRLMLCFRLRHAGQITQWSLLAKRLWNVSQASALSVSLAVELTVPRVPAEGHYSSPGF